MNRNLGKEVWMVLTKEIRDLNSTDLEIIRRGFREVITILFMVVALIYAAVVSFWLFYPYEPIVVKSPIKILNHDRKVFQGDDLIYEITYEKKMDICGKLSRKLINDFKLDLSDVPATSPVGKDKDIVLIKIPGFAEPGKYYLWWRCSYKVNPVRTITVNVSSEWFEVVK